MFNKIIVALSAGAQLASGHGLLIALTGAVSCACLTVYLELRREWADSVLK